MLNLYMSYMMKNMLTVLVVFALTSNCTSIANEKQADKASNELSTVQPGGPLDTATVAGGCFWCVEAAFEQIIGVEEAVSGYASGTKENADYRIVSSGRTRHSEAVQVYFDPSVIDYETILDIFFVAHDPTQLNRQGPDVGPQYRSAVYYHSEEQKRILEAKVAELNPKFNNKIVTEIEPLTTFFLAEDYHQDYEEKNPFQPYILAVSRPKVEKVKKTFPDLIRK